MITEKKVLPHSNTLPHRCKRCNRKLKTFWCYIDTFFQLAIVLGNSYKQTFSYPVPALLLTDLQKRQNFEFLRKIEIFYGSGHNSAPFEATRYGLFYDLFQSIFLIYGRFQGPDTSTF